MTDPWVCIDCGGRQPEQGSCRKCKHEDTLDARDDKVRMLMSDVERRLGDRREKRFRMVGVVVGMASVIALWMVPGFWQARMRFFALPILADQWILMALIGLGVAKVLEKKLGRRRFPYLRTDLSMS